MLSRGKLSEILLFQVPITVHYDHGTSKSDLLEVLEMVSEEDASLLLHMLLNHKHLYLNR